MTAERSRVDESTARGIVPRAATIPAILVLVMFWGLAAIPAQAQIGTPVDLGSNQADGVDGATVTSLKIKTSADAPAGSSVIVMALDLGMDRNALSALSVSCTDSAAHTYKTDVSLNGGSGAILSTHQIAATLPVGSAITVIWSGQSGLNSYRIRAFAVMGLASNPLDQTASPSNNFNSLPSSGTVTTTQASELLVGAIFGTASVSDAGFSPGTGYTALAGVGSISPSLFGEYRIVSMTGIYAATGSFTMDVHWAELLATYKAAAPAGPSFDTCLKDNSTGNLLQWNSTTGQYKFTRCSDGFMLTGTGTVGLVNGIRTLTDFKTDRRISAGLNTGQLTGHATIYLQVVQGVWQTLQIIDTNPATTCSCGT